LGASYGFPVLVSSSSWSQGVDTYTVAMDVAGSTTLAATAGSLKGTSGSITVDPGSATHFAVSSGSQETVGASFPVSITAEDAYNNIVTSYNQTPTLTPSYGIPLSLQVAGIHWSSGVGTATVTLENPGTTTLTAAAGTVKGTSNSITVDAVTSTTPNQAGYISYDSPATAVGANWVQPAASGTGSASFWVGLSDSPNVEQIGTQVQIVNGSPQYSAWYELIPNNPTAVPITTTNNGTPFVVSPGDHIQAAVFFVSSSGSNSTFHLLLQDTPANGGPTEFFDIDQTMANVNQASAEWIAEAPTIGKTVATLPNFGQVTFTGAWATIGSTTGPVNDFSGIQALNIVQNNVQVTTTSNPPAVSNSLGYQEFVQPNALGSSSFTVTYGAVPTGQAPLQANLATAPVAGSSSASAGPSNVPASALKQSQGVMQPPVDNSTPVNQPAPLDALVATNQLANQDDVMPSGSDYSLNDVVDALFAQYALESHLGIGPLL
jgi:hypothetical protein